MKVREIIHSHDMTLDASIEFLKTTPFGIVKDSSGNLITIEELKDAKSFGSKSGSGQDSTVTSDAEIPESPDRELFDFTGDNSE